MSDFYNTYNARYLHPEQVAENFIISDSFKLLTKNRHSIILGARGCGKTTAMKMLTLPALYTWNNKDAKELQQNLPFYAIYISTDIYWDVKNKSYEEQLHEFGNFFDLISKFSVNSSIFISLCETFLNIIKYEKFSEDRSKEVEISTILIDRWKLNNTIPQLIYVKESLLKRIDDVNQIIKNFIFNNEKTSKPPYYDFFSLDFDSSLPYIVSAFCRIYSISEKKKWALCFDELEFAPTWLQEHLYRSLRSRREQNFLFKISSSPILPKELEPIFNTTYQASAGNDFDCIKMWASGSKEEDFSIKLIESLLKSSRIKKSAKTFFGKNPLYLESRRESYTPSSPYMVEIKELADKDREFKKFLLTKDIDPNNPIPGSISQKASIYRKIKPIVYFRNYFIKINAESTELRTRNKSIELYNGIEILSKICEGNPRWLIGLINSIINRLEEGNHTNNMSIQYDEIMSVSNRFINSIENIAIELEDRDLTIKKFIDKIGNYFREEILGKEFKSEPASTFNVDVKNSDYIKIIEKGIFQGAFILIDDDNDDFDFEVNGKRLKLSYMYYPTYKLPIRKSKDVSLQKIFNEINFDNQTPNLFNQQK